MDIVILVTQVILNAGAVAGLGWRGYKLITKPISEKIELIHEDVKCLSKQKEVLEDRIERLEFYLTVRDRRFRPYSRHGEVKR